MRIPVGLYNNISSVDAELELETFHFTFVDGVSGSGKSTFLESVATDIIRAEEPIIFFDPHGTSARKLLKNIPRHLSEKVVYFNPLAKKVPGINFFDFTSRLEWDKAVANIVSIVKSHAGDSWGAESEHVTTTAGRAVLQEPQPTIIHMYLFVMRELYRDALIRSSDDSTLKDFQRQFDEELRASERMSKFSPALNKLFPFVQPVIRTIFGQVESMNFIELVDQGYIIIIDLDKGKIGDIAASLIGSAIMSYIQLKAMERKADKRRNCTIIIDEFQNFCHGVNWTTFFAELRKYDVRVWLATQSITQIPEKWLDPILTGSQNVICFAAGDRDAERMVKVFGGRCTEEQLIFMDDRVFFAKLKEGTRRKFYQDVRVYPPLEPRGDESNWRDVLKNSRMRWGKNRKDVDRGIVKLLNRAR
jgi:type IV secretory pathway TraG/TraD family ATPase VirD4